MPPVQPMLAKSVKGIPDPAKHGGGLIFEPKWDGFRCFAFRDGGDVKIMLKSGRSLARYLPEVVAMLRDMSAPDFVFDGELVIEVGGASDATRSRHASIRRPAGSRGFPSRRRPS